MGKYSSFNLKTLILDNFNSMIQSGSFDISWHHSIFQMIPKSGKLTDTKNWRPISILPILYKLFSRLLYDRISHRLLEYQSVDQNAFTPGIRIEDALLSAEASIEYALEYNVPLWMMSLDLRKAFDTIDHKFLLQSIGYHGLDPAYISLLKILYSNQTGSVKTSRSFKI